MERNQLSLLGFLAEIHKIKKYFAIEKMQFKQTLYTSDVNQLLMDVDGVRAINYVPQKNFKGVELCFGTKRGRSTFLYKIVRRCTETWQNSILSRSLYWCKISSLIYLC